MEKIELIECSLRVGRFGVPGIVPFFGLPFAIVALYHHRRISRKIGPQWNPAHRHRFWGAACAQIGTILTIAITVFLTAAFLMDLLN